MSHEFQTFVDSLSDDVICGSPGGIASRFVKLNDELGVKLYTDSHDRDDCMKRQELAAEKGFGPNVYGTLDINSDETYYTFGYVTECVRVLKDFFYVQGRYYTPFYGPYEQTGTSIDRLFLNNPSASSCHTKCLERDVLKDGLCDCTGLRFTDLHMNNIGIKNGTFVCIDFGEEGYY